jgi:hypothetical protein
MSASFQPSIVPGMTLWVNTRSILAVSLTFSRGLALGRAGFRRGGGYFLCGQTNQERPGLIAVAEALASIRATQGAVRRIVW